MDGSDGAERGGSGSARRVPTEAHNVPLILLTVFAVIFILDWGQTVFVPLVVALIVNYALSPLVDFMQKWRIPREVGAAMLLWAIVAGFGSLAYSLHDQAASMIETLPEAAQTLRRAVAREWGGSREAIENVQAAAEQIGRAAEAAAPAATPPRGVTRVQIEKPRLEVADYLWNGTLGALSFVSLAVMVLLLSYFLLASGDAFRRKLVKLSGPAISKKRVTVQVLNQIDLQIQRYLVVQVFTSSLVGLASWLAFAWIGLDHAAVLGVAAAVLNFIPYLGAIVITGGAALLCLMQFGTLGMTLAVAGISFVIQSVEGYFLTPWLSGRAGRMNGVVVFAGILFWGWLWGAWGLLLGMPIMMAVKSVCDHVDEFKPVAEFMGD